MTIKNKFILLSISFLLVVTLAVGIIWNLYNNDRISGFLGKGGVINVKVMNPYLLTDFPVFKLSSSDKVKIITSPHQTHLVYSQAPIQGWVVDQIYFSQGDMVTKGDKLLKYDLHDVYIQRSEAESKVDGARVNLEQAETDVEVAEKLLRNNAGPQVNVKKAESVKGVANSQLKGARAALDLVEEAFEKEIAYAPNSGFIISGNIKKGALVRSGDILFEIAEESALAVNFLVDSDMKKYFKMNDSLYVFFAESLGDKRLFQAKVVNVARENYMVNDYWNITVNVPEAIRKYLNSNIYKNDANLLETFQHIVDKGIELYLPQKFQDIVILRDAIIYEGGVPYVYVVNKNNRAEKRTIEVGVDYGDDYMEILNGLNEKDRVVVSSIKNLSSGAALNILNPEAYENR